MQLVVVVRPGAPGDPGRHGRRRRCGWSAGGVVVMLRVRGRLAAGVAGTHVELGTGVHQLRFLGRRLRRAADGGRPRPRPGCSSGVPGCRSGLVALVSLFLLVRLVWVSMETPAG